MPCEVDFRSMVPASRGRVCGECSTKVHDLSAMNEEEARALLTASRGERLCVRYLYDVSGRVRFAGDAKPDVPIVPEYRLTGRLRARLAQAALVTAPFLLEACGTAGLPQSRDAEADVTSETGHVLPDARVVQDAGADATAD